MQSQTTSLKIYLTKWFWGHPSPPPRCHYNTVNIRIPIEMHPKHNLKIEKNSYLGRMSFPYLNEYTDSNFGVQDFLPMKKPIP